MASGARKAFNLTLLLLTLLAASVSLTSGCGSDAAGQASTSPSSASSASAAPNAVAGTLLVVRREDGSWTLRRVTPSESRDERLGTLPFRPTQALASPDGANVLYIGAGARLALVDAASGGAEPVSLADFPVRSIDGATWISASEVVFAGCRGAYASPEGSSLYHLDAATGGVSSFHGLSGGEPSYASNAGSLIFVTRDVVARTSSLGAGPWARERLLRLRSVDAAKGKLLHSQTAYVDAGRSFNTPLISPDGRYVLSAATGTDVSATYELFNGKGHSALTVKVQAVAAAAWGDARVAFIGSRHYGAGGPLALFVYDEASGNLLFHRIPNEMFDCITWSPTGDLALGVSWWPSRLGVFVASGSDLSSWVKVANGSLPVWVR